MEMTKILRGFKYITLIVLLAACVQLINHRWENYLSISKPIKDEILFVNKYNYFQINGWYESIVHGTSPVYNAAVFLVDQVIGDPFISMKAVNILCMIGIIGIWVYFLLVDLKISNRYRWLSVLTIFYLTVVFNSFFSACNDSPFLLFMSLGIYALLKTIREYRNSVFLLAALCFALALGTRELLVFYIPGIFSVLVILIFYKLIKIKAIILFVLVFALATGAIYFPSIIENKSLAFLDKNEGIYEGYWQEKNYLQLKLNVGKLERVDVESYKERNPDVILPQSYLKGIFMDPVLTLKNSIRQFKLINFALVWKLGVLYLIFLGLVIGSVIKKEFLNPELLIFLIFILYALAFSILPLNRVEFRWFILFPILFFVLSIYRLDLLGDKNKRIEFLVYSNFLIIGIVNFMLIGIW